MKEETESEGGRGEGRGVCGGWSGGRLEEVAAAEGGRAVRRKWKRKRKEVDEGWCSGGNEGVGGSVHAGD